jgi:4-carboxymuconolactone decarboxylase
MINLAMLTALGRFEELGIYVKGALRSGVTVQEIQEVLLHSVARMTPEQLSAVGPLNDG